MLYATEIQCLCTVNYKFKCGLKTSVSLVLATEHLKTVSRVMKSLLYGHPSNTDTLLCPFRVRIREIQLYWLSTSPPGRGGDMSQKLTSFWKPRRPWGVEILGTSRDLVTAICHEPWTTAMGRVLLVHRRQRNNNWTRQKKRESFGFTV